MPRPLPLAQIEVDQRFGKLLDDSGVKLANIAQRLHYKSHSTISRWFNWEEADQSPFVMALRCLEAFRDEQPGLDRDALDLFVWFAEQVVGAKRKVEGDADKLLNEAQKSVSELVDARFNNLPFADRLPYARQLKARASELEVEYMSLDCEDGGAEPAKASQSFRSIGRAS